MRRHIANLPSSARSLPRNQWLPSPCPPHASGRCSNSNAAQFETEPLDCVCRLQRVRYAAAGDAPDRAIPFAALRPPGSWTRRSAVSARREGRGRLVLRRPADRINSSGRLAPWPGLSEAAAVAPRVKRESSGRRTRAVAQRAVCGTSAIPCAPKSRLGPSAHTPDARRVWWEATVCDASRNQSAE